jgi:hypothetical protein
MPRKHLVVGIALALGASLSTGCSNKSDEYSDPFSKVNVPPPSSDGSAQAPAVPPGGAGDAPGAGAPGQPPVQPAPGSPVGIQAPLASASQVKLSGTLTLPKDAPSGAIQIDANVQSGTNSGPLYSARLNEAGPFTLIAPKGAGSVSLMIYVGVKGNDPGTVGPSNIYMWGPIDVGSEDVTGIKLDLSDPSVQHGAMDPAAMGVPPGAGAAPAPGGAPATGAAPAPGGAAVGAPLAPGVYAPTANAPTGAPSTAAPAGAPSTAAPVGSSSAAGSSSTASGR